MVKDNLLRIRERISSACARVNRSLSEITVIAVSKGRALSEIKEAIDSGIADIGESRVQEASDKFYAIRDTQYAERKIKWHLIGRLQTNKVKEAVRIFDLIHSVDSLRLAQEIDRQAAKINKIQEILLEVKTSSEETKTGFTAEESVSTAQEIAKLKNISIKGLMTIAPAVDNPEKTRPYFRMLRQLKDKIYELRVTDYELRILSMGMTDDFEIAIEEGANMVRLGRAIFE